MPSSAPSVRSTVGTASSSRSPASSPGDTPPTHKINLSLAPRARYASLATAYAPRLRSITSIFDTLVLQILPESYLPWIKSLARVLLRRVYDGEETEEIRGIAEATGIEVYLVVCLNVLLDLLMGCTSGAALYKPPRGEEEEGGGENGNGEARMLHFRTLDWDMPALRELLVTLEFVDSDELDAPVLARNITYVGFVGVLTGVRPGLSVSLNFRPNHDDDTWVKNFKYYGRHLLVLLGFKRSISSILRQTIIPSKLSKPGWLSYIWLWNRNRSRQPLNTLPLDQTVSHILSTPSTACYLILSDGRETYVLEKDYRTTTVESSSSFIVATNNDRSTAVPRSGPTDHSSRQEHTGASLTTASDPVLLVDFIKDSIERRACMQAHWDMKVARTRQAIRRASQGSGVSLGSVSARTDPLRRTRSSQSQSQSQRQATQNQATDPTPSSPAEHEATATLEELVTWTSRYPTTNEMTHFATVLDPVKGSIAWIKRYLEPLECDWEMTDFE
ncbi:beta subunit of N-acylethanolamine-hydrolyzing acid amidase-domain-containing protein [Aspergillus carlsbadensis]|nr:beta subunit of N-acylethanolamine-hydrolyzing acid amidase-domain-containing protein [Aspergillus carlsbadensis]